MDLESKLTDLSKTVREHREVLLTEEAAKNALVMPFLQALGYNVFNPAEVVPEFTADVGTKKGEKVDYAICNDGKVSILVECKPAKAELSANHASQLMRYFHVTEARIAILTNGVIFKFYSDTDQANKMDERPFLTLDMENVKKADVKALQDFTKDNFNIDRIVATAGNLKMQSHVAKELEKEFADPSDDFVNMIAKRVVDGRVTASVRETFEGLIVASINSLIRDKVNDRLTSALQASNPIEADDSDSSADDGIETTEVEIEGFNIIRAIGTRVVDPSRIAIRDQKSYCAVLLDDNNRKTIARLHFNSRTARYLGTFHGKDETRHSVDGPRDLYGFEKQITDRIKELEM
ncbi:type I restriction endonuclease [Erythrobacter ani]|uniref:Type I restriction enzyme HsdR N-terminal domain-containing protein n=1 Tax=Erythrobacter ani TaxID=2827235 RepID=A0ABS6SPG5_9SPHN|nr:type I restriction endonuclease [Erythrobacter ani]MBV7266880.1 type I restriction enzyme HsdR N-terminal domain-containing protein [Erythrobacter ani]